MVQKRKNPVMPARELTPARGSVLAIKASQIKASEKKTYIDLLFNCDLEDWERRMEIISSFGKDRFVSRFAEEIKEYVGEERGKVLGKKIVLAHESLKNMGKVESGVEVFIRIAGENPNKIEEFCDILIGLKKSTMITRKLITALEWYDPDFSNGLVLDELGFDLDRSDYNDLEKQLRITYKQIGLEIALDNIHSHLETLNEIEEKLRGSPIMLEMVVANAILLVVKNKPKDLWIVINNIYDNLDRLNKVEKNWKVEFGEDLEGMKSRMSRFFAHAIARALDGNPESLSHLDIDLEFYLGD